MKFTSLPRPNRAYQGKSLAALTLACRRAHQPAQWVQAARAFRSLERIREAKHLLRTGLKYFPRNGKMHYELACCHGLLDEVSSSKKHLTKACALDPGFIQLASENYAFYPGIFSPTTTPQPHAPCKPVPAPSN